MAASPDLKNVGFSSLVWPERGSSFFLSSMNVHAVWVVWQWKTGVYPTVIALGCWSTTICAVNSSATVGGASAGPQTSPRRMSPFAIPRTLKPTLSPGTAWGISSWCISMDLISPSLFAGHEGDFHSFLHDTGFDTADRHSSDTADAVDILNWQAEGLVGWF